MVLYWIAMSSAFGTSPKTSIRILTYPCRILPRAKRLSCDWSLPIWSGSVRHVFQRCADSPRRPIQSAGWLSLVPARQAPRARALSGKAAHPFRHGLPTTLAGRCEERRFWPDKPFDLGGCGLASLILPACRGAKAPSKRASTYARAASKPRLSRD
jgi:hypothetical protein